MDSYIQSRCQSMDLFSSNLSDLIAISDSSAVKYKNGKDLQQRLVGRFYTPELIGRQLIDDLPDLEAVSFSELKIIDPFCGDGRLIKYYLEYLASCPQLISVNKICVSLWDCEAESVKLAAKMIGSFQHYKFKEVVVDERICDSFFEIENNLGKFDICLTNPPWEVLKPDAREMFSLTDEQAAEYTKMIKAKAFILDRMFPQARPSRKFSGWGTNLARCGIEAAVKLVRPGGSFGIVAPSTLFGDQTSARMRTWLFEEQDIAKLRYYPAEARLFDEVDQGTACISGRRNAETSGHIKIHLHSAQDPKESEVIDLRTAELALNDYAIGFKSSQKIFGIMQKLTRLPRLSDFEGESNCLKLGRELDETGLAEKLASTGRLRFLKGRFIQRYSVKEHEPSYVKDGVSVPSSVNLKRIAWRDVSRQSMPKRMQATIISPGTVTGNSSNVAIIHSDCGDIKLKALLAIFNSSVFEIQARTLVSTNHLSVGAVRKMRVPDFRKYCVAERLASLVLKFEVLPSMENLYALDSAVADEFGLSREDYHLTLAFLAKHDPDAGQMYSLASQYKI